MSRITRILTRTTEIPVFRIGRVRAHGRVETGNSAPQRSVSFGMGRLYKLCGGSSWRTGVGRRADWPSGVAESPNRNNLPTGVDVCLLLLSAAGHTLFPTTHVTTFHSVSNLRQQALFLSVSVLPRNHIRHRSPAGSNSTRDFSSNVATLENSRWLNRCRDGTRSKMPSNRSGEKTFSNAARTVTQQGIPFTKQLYTSASTIESIRC